MESLMKVLSLRGSWACKGFNGFKRDSRGRIGFNDFEEFCYTLFQEEGKKGEGVGQIHNC